METQLAKSESVRQQHRKGQNRAISAEIDGGRVTSHAENQAGRLGRGARLSSLPAI